MSLEVVEARAREVLSRHPEVRFALLFGSAATRGLEGARDVDIAVAFSSPPALVRLAALGGELEDALGRGVDVVDLESASTLLRWEVARTGRVLCAPDAQALAEFGARVPLEYFDLEPHLERQSRGLRRAVLGPQWSASRS